MLLRILVRYLPYVCMYSVPADRCHCNLFPAYQVVPFEAAVQGTCNLSMRICYSLFLTNYDGVADPTLVKPQITGI